MEELVKRVQKMLVEEYRCEHPEVSDYSDEEIALINPVSDADIVAYIALEKMELRKNISDIEKMIASLNEDIVLSQERINDPRTFNQDRTEARRDIIDDYAKITKLKEKTQKLLQKIAELDNLDRQENEKRSR